MFSSVFVFYFFPFFFFDQKFFIQKRAIDTFLVQLEILHAEIANICDLLSSEIFPLSHSCLCCCFSYCYNLLRIESRLVVVVVQSLSRVQLLQPHRLQPSRFLCPWDSPGKNSKVGCHFLLQGIFPTQELNPGLSCITGRFFTN